MLDWFRKPKVVVEQWGEDIIVTLPGTGFTVVYAWITS